MAKHTDTLGTFENFRAPWESETGEDQTPDPTKLKKYLYNLLSDKAKAQDAREEATAKVTSLEAELETAKGEVAKGDPTGKIADLEKKLAKAQSEAESATLAKARLEIGVEKGLSPKQAARLVGTTKEELEADADELLEAFGVTKDKKVDDNDDDDDDDEVVVDRRIVNPADRDNGSGAEPDYEAVANQVFGARLI